MILLAAKRMANPLSSYYSVGTIVSSVRAIERCQNPLPLPINMEAGVRERDTGRARRGHTKRDTQAGLGPPNNLHPSDLSGTDCI
jgi:hypothetical protein